MPAANSTAAPCPSLAPLAELGVLGGPPRTCRLARPLWGHLAWPSRVSETMLLVVGQLLTGLPSGSLIVTSRSRAPAMGDEQHRHLDTFPSTLELSKHTFVSTDPAPCQHCYLPCPSYRPGNGLGPRTRHPSKSLETSVPTRPCDWSYSPLPRHVVSVNLPSD